MPFGIRPYQELVERPFNSWWVPNVIDTWDMRGSDSKHLPGQTLCMFRTDDPADLKLGDDLEANITAVQRDGIQALVGKSVLSNKLADVLWELKTRLADPTGITFRPPMIGTVLEDMQYKVGNRIFHTERMVAGSALWDANVASFQHAYRQRRPVEDLDTLRKYTGSQLRRFGIRNPDIILPPEYQGDGSSRPDTTFTESFAATADADGLGTNFIQTTTITGWDRVSDQALMTGVSGVDQQRHTTALSDDTHMARTTTVSVSHQGGQVELIGAQIRMPASSVNSGYHGDARVADGTDTYRLQEITSGSSTNLGASPASRDYSAGDVIELEITAAAGGTVTLNVGTETVLSATGENTHSGNTSVALFGQLTDGGSNVIAAEFHADDFAVGGAARRVFIFN